MFDLIFGINILENEVLNRYNIQFLERWFLSV
jgi:hypothetical protein